MKKIFTLLFSAGCITAMAQTAFIPGNIVVYRVGEGTATLRGVGTYVFLDEYSPAGVRVRSVAIPDKAASGTGKGLVASGSAANEGMITRSVDGKYVMFTGYNADTGRTAIAGSNATAVGRAVGRINATGTFQLDSLGKASFSTAGIRSVASTNGTDLYLAGSNGGIRKGTFGDTTTTRINMSGAGTVSNFRAVSIYDGQLYATTSSGTTYRMVTVGTGLPTDTAQVITQLPGIPTTGSPNQFFFADVDATPGADVLYIADNGAAANGGGIQKYSLVAGSWVANGAAMPAKAGTTGLTGTATSGVVTLYTTSGSNATGFALSALTDATGYNQTIAQNFIQLDTAATNTAFRGVAMAPVLSLVPVKLVSFNAALSAEGTKVNWKAANEVNVKGYTVERSVDGRNYTVLGTVAAANRTEGNYSFIDKNVAEGINYYRLKMTDADGSFKYSNIATINNRSVIKAEIYPNPATDNIVVKHSKAIAGATITITNAEGQQVRKIAVQQGTAQTGVIVDNLAKGNYMLMFDNNGDKSVVKFVKQ